MSAVPTPHDVTFAIIRNAFHDYRTTPATWVDRRDDALLHILELITNYLEFNRLLRVADRMEGSDASSP